MPSSSAGAVLFLLVVTTGAPARAGVYELEPQRSHVVIHVHKAGALSAMLHDHAFVPQRWQGTLDFDPAAPASARGEIVFDAGSLRDEEQGLSADDRAKVEQQVRGADVLDVARYPEVRLEVTGVELGQPASGTQDVPVVVVGTFSLHGKRVPVRLPLTARWSPEALEAWGRARFRQSDFGIRPLSKMLGAIAVKDDLMVEVDVHARTAAARPPP